MAKVRGPSHLTEDTIHNMGSQKDFSITNGYRNILNDGSVEGLDKVFHAGLHMEVPLQKSSHINDSIRDVLFSHAYWRKKLLHVAHVSLAAQLDQRFLVLIK